MYGIKYVLWLLVLSIPMSYAVTTADVKKLNVNNFFGEWSKFLDQVLQAQQEQISQENEKIYQSFIQQAKTLNIPKVTGNKQSISAMEEQIKLVQKRIQDTKQLSAEWKQFSESVMNAQQPVSVENQEAYKELIKRAKDVGIEKAQLDAMETKMNEIKNKFGLAVPPRPVTPAPMMPPVTPTPPSFPAYDHKQEVPIPPMPELKK